MDAKIWADEFCARNSAADHGAMAAWFANAIMIGYDRARWENESTQSVMRDQALKWRVSFKTTAGMYTFIDISKRGGFKLDRAEVEDWAETQVRSHPDTYASVAAVLNLDDDVRPNSTLGVKYEKREV
jgi:hypothetical protein